MPVTLKDILLTFRDTSKKIKLKGDLLQTKTNENYKIDLAKSSDRKTLYKFAKNMYFEGKALGKRNNSDKTRITLLKSPAVIVSGTSNFFHQKMQMNYVID